MGGAQARPRRKLGRKRASPLFPLLISLLAVVLGGLAHRALLQGGESRNILLMGVDQGGLRTDVLVLASVRPRQGEVRLLSLPRDTLVEIPCQGRDGCRTPDKLGHAHAYGGPALAVRTVEQLLGLPVAGYVRVDFDGFAAAVDALGGVEMVIERDMIYTDPDARPPLRIDFRAGPEPRRLAGAEALLFVRYRGDGRGDVGRIERTQGLMRALLEAARAGGPSRAAAALRAAWPHVDTDLDLMTALWLARQVASLTPGEVRTAVVPGAPETTGGASVWRPDRARLRQVVADLFGGR